MDMCASAKLNSKIILSHHPHTMCKGVCFHTCTATAKGQDFDYLFFTPGKAGWYLLFFILSSWAPGLLYSVGDTQEEKLETGAPYWASTVPFSREASSSSSPHILAA